MRAVDHQHARARRNRFAHLLHRGHAPERTLERSGHQGLDVFRAEEDACLLGTDALRDGVDVPGESLHLFEKVDATMTPVNPAEDAKQ